MADVVGGGRGGISAPRGVGTRPEGVFVVGGAVEGKNGARRREAKGGGGPGKGHGEVATSGPTDGDETGAIGADIGAADGEGGQGVARPVQGGADVVHGAVEEGGFGAEAVVDADGEEAGVEEGLGLGWADVFAGEHHVAPTVDHEGWCAIRECRCEYGLERLTNWTGYVGIVDLCGIVDVCEKRNVTLLFEEHGFLSFQPIDCTVGRAITNRW